MDNKDWQKEIEEQQNKYGQECLDELKVRGFKTDDLTSEQAVLILEPSHAPENFYCDGEISHAQALEKWKNKMMRAGMTPLQRFKAQQCIFG
jgi:hypothetical protein